MSNNPFNHGQVKVTENRWTNISDDAVVMPDTLQNSQHYIKLSLREFPEKCFSHAESEKSDQNSRHPALVNLPHGLGSKFCKRHITQRTSRLNAKLRRIQTICITYLDL
jgi:hypothetical protein